MTIFNLLDPEDEGADVGEEEETDEEDESTDVLS